MVKVVCFVPAEVGTNSVMPTLYVSKHVIQISYLWSNPILIGDEFNEKITSDNNFTKIKNNGNVYSGIKREDIKHSNSYYYVSKPNGISLLCYDGKEDKVIYIPDEINGEPVVGVAGEAFQFLQGKVDFIKYPEKCGLPIWPKVLHANHKTIMANKYMIFDEPTINHCYKASGISDFRSEILDYVEQNGFKMLHIKDVDEEGYVIVGLDYSVREKQIMNPPTEVNNLKVLGISGRLLKSHYMNSGMAKRYYSIYKKIY